MIAVWFAIIIFFIIWGIRDYKKSFLTYAAVSLLINAGMAIRYAPPSIGVSLVLHLYFVLLYYYKEKTRYKTSLKFPLKKAFVWMSVSISISALVTWVNGSISGITSAINSIFGIYLFIYVFWNVCNDSKDIKYFITCLVVIFAISFAYGIFEYSTHSNPILDSIKAVIPAEYSEGKLAMSDALNLRDGRFRAQSLFHISILYGINSVLFLFFILFVNKNKQYLNFGKIGILLIVCLSLFACYTSNSKTPLVAIPIFVLPYVLKNKIVFALFLVLSFVMLANPNLILSLLGDIINLEAFDTKNDDMSGGSNIYMRMLQLEASFEYWMKAPVFGNGLRAGAIFSERDSRLFGCESVWFRTMIERGTLGLVAYIILIINCLKVSLKYERKYILFMYSLAFYVMCSITDINYTMYFMCFCVMLKICKNTLRDNEKGNNLRNL